MQNIKLRKRLKNPKHQQSTKTHRCTIWLKWMCFGSVKSKYLKNVTQNYIMRFFASGRKAACGVSAVKCSALEYALCLWSPGSLWFWIPSYTVEERWQDSRGFFFPYYKARVCLGIVLSQRNCRQHEWLTILFPEYFSVFFLPSSFFFKPQHYWIFQGVFKIPER